MRRSADALAALEAKVAQFADALAQDVAAVEEMVRARQESERAASRGQPVRVVVARESEEQAMQAAQRRIEAAQTALRELPADA